MGKVIASTTTTVDGLADVGRPYDTGVALPRYETVSTE
jgi:hypothetical protein